MTVVTIAGLIFGAWAMLSLIGSERQRELVICRRKFADETEAAAAKVTAPPPAARTAAKPGTPAAKNR
jgi:hypothetical protein